MEAHVASYRRRLDLSSLGLVLALTALPAALGFALAGVPGVLGVLLAVTLLGLVRNQGDADLPGTHRLQPFQAPGLFHLTESLARRAGLGRMPEVRWVPGGQTNAAATLRGTTPVLVVTEALLARLDTRQLGAVLAHETAHLAHRDLVVFRYVRTAQTATVILSTTTLVLATAATLVAPDQGLFWAVFSGVAPVASRLLGAALSRTREFAADLGASRLTGDPGALADALERIEYRPRTWWDWVTGTRTPVPTDPAADAFRTHPATAERIRRLDLLARWAA